MRLHISPVSQLGIQQVFLRFLIVIGKRTSVIQFLQVSRFSFFITVQGSSVLKMKSLFIRTPAIIKVTRTGMIINTEFRLLMVQTGRNRIVMKYDMRRVHHIQADRATRFMPTSDIVQHGFSISISQAWIFDVFDTENIDRLQSVDIFSRNLYTIHAELYGSTSRHTDRFRQRIDLYTRQHQSLQQIDPVCRSLHLFLAGKHDFSVCLVDDIGCRYGYFP